MIVRTWSGRVPLAQAGGFHAHLLATGVAEYRAQPGCRAIWLWRSDEEGGIARFTLMSVWTNMAAIRGYAGEDPQVAMLYADDARFGLVPDRVVEHHALLLADPGIAA
jgi:hypothetical protein